ncbi:hypothetical protein PPTG_20936 [Phytophthora nicotianae INRA-310]|uniref:Uncharacterized protein n=1 Tax=Phytophthora nicotianae (strain INRA-310) TaxID=761204 RepID=W2RAZ2_PHYN3|nr:hypothetical protein PPTG_20936 [Phytophthora nicotianae INRA-310]ETN22542.1 hypothetical protein PPTG_20936 [Phytophthora nicotianae INRA-310]
MKDAEVLQDGRRPARGDLLLDQEFEHGCFSMLAQAVNSRRSNPVIFDRVSASNGFKSNVEPCSCSKRHGRRSSAASNHRSRSRAEHLLDETSATSEHPSLQRGVQRGQEGG